MVSVARNFESRRSVSSLEFTIHDNVLLNGTDGAPATNAGFRLLLEEQIEKRPTWLNPDEQRRCFANNEGWWLRHNKNSAGTQFWDEQLVAIGDLAGTDASTGLGVAQITKVSFEGLTSGAQNNNPSYSVASAGTLANAFVQVVWNEPVDFTESTMPTLVVTHTATSDSSETSYTATAAAGTARARSSRRMSMIARGKEKRYKKGSAVKFVVSAGSRQHCVTPWPPPKFLTVAALLQISFDNDRCDASTRRLVDASTR